MRAGDSSYCLTFIHIVVWASYAIGTKGKKSKVVTSVNALCIVSELLFSSEDIDPIKKKIACY